jgi:ElaB/YqjD/DUF883 family membrane-anchored ribosome-binding protein
MSGADNDNMAGATGAAVGGSPGQTVPEDPDEVRLEIERTREQLGETVEQLAAKADVKKQAQDKAAELRAQMQARASQLKDKAGTAAQQAQRAAGRGVSQIQQRPVPLAAAAAAASLLVLGYVIITWRRSARKT